MASRPVLVRPVSPPRQRPVRSLDLLHKRLAAPVCHFARLPSCHPWHLLQVHGTHVLRHLAGKRYPHEASQAYASHPGLACIPSTEPGQHLTTQKSASQPQAAVPAAQPAMPEVDPLIFSYSHLADFPRASDALLTIKKIASLVKPLMRARGWTVRQLTEFYPNQENLLGR